MLSLVCGSKQLSNHEHDGECQPSGAKPVFGLYGSSGVERSAASDAVVAAVSSVSVSESDFGFEAPSRREHPVVSVSDTDSVEYAFIAVFVGVGEHECKGVQFCSPDVVDGEFGGGIEEVSIEWFPEPETGFGSNEDVFEFTVLSEAPEVESRSEFGSPSRSEGVFDSCVRSGLNPL